jgi:hypothetical protein
MIANSAFKRMQVDARPCWLNTGEHHRGLALRTSGALNCNEWNGGRQALRLGHDATLEYSQSRPARRRCSVLLTVLVSNRGDSTERLSDQARLASRAPVPIGQEAQHAALFADAVRCSDSPMSR